jgi:hypothetical protein
MPDPYSAPAVFSFSTADWTRHMIPLPNDLNVEVLTQDSAITTVRTTLAGLSRLFDHLNQRRSTPDRLMEVYMGMLSGNAQRE